MNFPLSYLCLNFGYPPESTLIVALVVSVCCLLLRLIFLRTMVGLSVKKFLRKVCMNVLQVTIVAAMVPLFIYMQMSDSLMRFLLICIVTVFCSSLTIYFVGCSSNERNFIKGKMLSIYQKIF